MLKNTREIQKADLLREAAHCLAQGYRIVTITCTDLGDAHDLLYHFDKNYELLNLRLRLPKGEELQSLSHIYFAAVIVENELKDLFGIPVKDLVIDYQGRLLLAEGAPTAPLNKSAAPAADSKPSEAK